MLNERPRRMGMARPRATVVIVDGEGNVVSAQFRSLDAAESKRLKLCQSAGVNPCNYSIVESSGLVDA